MIGTLVAEEEYLATHFEHDAEWVDGEVVERPMPMLPHSETQGRLFELTPRRHGGRKLTRAVELRVKIDRRYRVIDYCVYEGERPADVPTTPPQIAAEVLSPDESMSGLIDKMNEYARWGVRHRWVLDPVHRHLYVHDGALRPVDKLQAPEIGLSIDAEALWD